MLTLNKRIIWSIMLLIGCFIFSQTAFGYDVSEESSTVGSEIAQEKIKTQHLSLEKRMDNLEGMIARLRERHLELVQRLIDSAVKELESATEKPLPEVIRKERRPTSDRVLLQTLIAKLQDETKAKAQDYLEEKSSGFADSDSDDDSSGKGGHGHGGGGDGGDSANEGGAGSPGDAITGGSSMGGQDDDPPGTIDPGDDSGSEAGMSSLGGSGGGAGGGSGGGQGLTLGYFSKFSLVDYLVDSSEEDEEEASGILLSDPSLKFELNDPSINANEPKKVFERTPDERTASRTTTRTTTTSDSDNSQQRGRGR